MRGIDGEWRGFNLQSILARLSDVNLDMEDSKSSLWVFVGIVAHGSGNDD